MTMVGAPVVVVQNPVGSNWRKNLLVALSSEVLAHLNAAGVAALVAALVFLPSEALAELNAAGVDCFNAAVAVLTAASLMVAFEAEAHQLTLDTLFD